MSQNDVQQIKERLGIEEVVGTYIKLEKAGKNLKARCPFHNEKSPSFIISPDRGTYYCFGCGAKGDIFSFVQEFEGLDFSGSLKVLAERAGITLSKNSGETNEKTNRLRKILDLTTEYFQKNLLKNNEAKKYLLGRGLTEKTVEEWQIGFAPDGWQNLLDNLREKKYQLSEIEEVGLIKKGDKGKFYDRFRNRIMFPIFDSSGRPVGFTGRIFNGKPDDAKYLNSPETFLFEKSKLLYGFDRAKQAIRKNDFSILVEGQMDLIMCHQAGYRNAVASSGTALTQDQLEKLLRISNKLVIAYDSDSAGFKASEKAWQMALNLGFDVKIAPIEGGKDPADVIKLDVNQWKQIVRNSQHIVEIIISKIKRESSELREIGKRVATELIPYVANISSHIDQYHFVKMISEKFGLDEDAIKSEITNYLSKNVSSGTVASISESKIKNTSTENQIFGIIFWQEQEKNKIVDVEKLQNQLKEILTDDYHIICQKVSSEKNQLVFEMEAIYSDAKRQSKIASDIEELLINLKIRHLMRKKELQKNILAKAEKTNDETMQAECLRQIDALSKEISLLVNK